MLKYNLGHCIEIQRSLEHITFIAALVSFAGMVVYIANVFGALIMYTNFATRLPNIILTYNMNTLSPKIVGSLGGFMFTISAGSGAILAVSAAVFGIISFICTFKTFSTRNAVGKVTPDVEAVEDYGDMRGEYKGGNMRRPSRTAGGRNERERYNVYEDDRYDNRQSYRTSFRPISEYHEEKPAETYYGSAQKAATSTANYFTSFFTAKPAEKEVNIPNSRESYDDFEPVQQRRPSATRRPINAGGRFREPEPSWKPKAKPQAKKSKWSIYSAQPSRDSYFN